MRLLVDACVWSLLLRRRTTIRASNEQAAVSLLERVIRDGRAAIIGPVRQEVLSGVKHEAQFEKLRETLALFRDESISTSDYEEAARLYNRCRGHGIECGATDILLCAVAIRLQYGILTTDQGLERCATFLKI